jgi:pSer/pThr/pTyr-binding forkhead associated (FHA) protein
MSEMEDFVDVKVTQEGRRITEGCYRLPVTIGRGEHNMVRIGHSPQNKTISRTHAIVQVDGGRLQLVDRSANGTIHCGQRIRQGSMVALESSDSFEIFDFKISVRRVKPDPAIPIIFEAHVLVDGYRRNKPFMIGEMLLVCFKTSRDYRFEQMPAQADFRSIFAKHRLDAEYAVAAIRSEQGEGNLVTPSDSSRPPIAVNRWPVTLNKQALHKRDVIQIENVRIEILPLGERSLKCSNPACQLLNPYEPHGKCWFCHRELVDAETREPSGKTRPKRPGA